MKIKNILIMAVIAFALTACGGKPGDKDKAEVEENKAGQSLSEQQALPDDIAAEMDEDAAIAEEEFAPVDESETEDSVVIEPASEPADGEGVEQAGGDGVSPAEMVAEKTMKNTPPSSSGEMENKPEVDTSTPKAK